MSSAVLIVFRIGVTGGLAWEAEQAVGLGRPNNLVLLIPDGGTYERFRSHCGRFFPKSLPQWLPYVGGKVLPDTDKRFCEWPESKGDIQAIMRFDDAWNPSVVLVRAREPQAFFVRRAERKAFRLVFKAVGIGPIRPKMLTRISRMIKLGAAVILVAVMGIALTFCALLVLEKLGLD
jgi:hypothetical protein